MTMRDNQHDQPLEFTDDASILRAASDDELRSDADRDALEALRRDDARTDERLAFERSLRQRVSAVMSEPARAPESLRQRIEGVFASECDAAGPARTRDRSFWSRKPVLALAAALALLIGAAVATQLLTGPRTTAESPVQAHLISATQFISAEHDRCEPFNAYFDRKFTVRDIDHSVEEAVRILGAPPVRIDLNDAGYAFAGLGRCAVPGDGDSMHAIYRALNGQSGALSLFVQQANARPDIEPNVRYRVPTSSGAPLIVWRDGGLIYYLFAPIDADVERVTRLLSSPQRELTL